MPNAVFTFNEYLLDFATPPTKEKGLKLIQKILGRSKFLKTRMTGVPRRNRQRRKRRSPIFRPGRPTFSPCPSPIPRQGMREYS